MAELKVEVLEIEEVIEHPNADRLDLATVLGYQVVVGRDEYVKGDRAVYFPVDSILPKELQDVIFAGSKMSLTKDRVRAARIRGAMSFGLLVSLRTVKSYLYRKATTKENPEYLPLGYDLTYRLGVTKFQPPVNRSLQRDTKAKARRHRHPDFKKYTNIQHLKRSTRFMDSYDGVVAVTEKIHGTNFRAGWLPFRPRTLWQKIKKALGFGPEYEFVYGSHNVQLQDGGNKARAAFGDNVYKRAVDKYDLRNVINHGEVWYGEIYGYGIQDGYGYGCKPGEFKLAIFDIMADGKFESLFWVNMICKRRKIPCVPIIKVIPRPTGGKDILEKASEFLNLPDGSALKSTRDRKTPMEGVVVRPYHEEVNVGGRLIFKLISDEYLLEKNNTDFH